MHAISLLQTWLERNGVTDHQARVGALMRVVESLLSGGRLSLTQLGRYRPDTAYVSTTSKRSTGCWETVTYMRNAKESTQP